MIFGAHPDRQHEEEVVPKQKRKDNPHMFLCSYFMHHPRTKMYQVFTYDDKQILNAGVKRLRDRGFSTDQITGMIDRFYASPMGTVQHPVMPFVSKRMLDSLISGSAETVTDDISRFVANGYERDDTMELPWDEEFDQEIKARSLRASAEERKGIIGAYLRNSH